MHPVRDLTNQRFGRLLVVRRVENSPSGNLKWMCLCDCGAHKAVGGCNLKTGATLSCGCLRSERVVARLQDRKIAEKHGLTNSREYGTWQRMRRRVRCNPRYAERGMDPGWYQDFSLFYLYLQRTIGMNPGPGWSIDRIDNDQGYFPGNVRWLTMDANRRRPRPRGKTS